MKTPSYFILFVMYLGALMVYPSLTFIILMNRWAEWIDKNLKENFKNI